MFSSGSYAKLWEIKSQEKFSDARISTSKKDKETGEYKQDFGGYVRLVGQAHEQASRLFEGDRFKIVRCGVENSYNKESRQTFYRFLIFELEKEEESADEGNPFV